MVDYSLESERTREKARRVLRMLSSGDLKSAASEIATISTGEIDRYILTGIALYRSGDISQSNQIFKQMNMLDIERFMVDCIEYIDENSAKAILHCCLGREPFSENAPEPITIFSFPKSGSTFLEAIIKNYTSRPTFSMTSANDSDSVNLDALVFEQALRPGSIVRGHLSANARCIARCIAYNIKPIFIYRNIFESIMSFSDHFKEKYYPYPFFIEEDVALKVGALKMAFHYVEMYASWFHMEKRYGKVLIMSYEENKKDWFSAAEKILYHSGLSVDHKKLKNAVNDSADIIKSDPARVRYNKGGDRNWKNMDEQLVSLIRSAYRAFPGVDFSPIDPEFTPR